MIQSGIDGQVAARALGSGVLDCVFRHNELHAGLPHVGRERALQISCRDIELLR